VGVLERSDDVMQVLVGAAWAVVIFIITFFVVVEFGINHERKERKRKTPKLWNRWPGI